MQKYIGIQCPVCKNEFCEGDDIVTCPECGTPHHRECYNMIGKCVNNGLHGSGYAFESKSTENTPNEEKADAIIGEYYTPDNEKQNNQPPIMGAQFDINQLENQFGTSNETIDGNSLVDVASTIRINIPRFIKKFKEMEIKNKKISWNWGAFFFGGLYYLFRKMYKQGVSLVFIFVAIIYLCDSMLFKLAPNYMEAVKNAAEAYAAGNTIDPNMIMTADSMTAMKIMYGIFALILVIRVVCALIADYCYKGTVAEIIAKVDKGLEENMTFVQSPMMQSESNLSQSQMRKMYLARKGGVNLFFPTLVVFAVYNLTYLL